MVMMSRQNINSFGQLPGMTTLNTITPCAACKLLRRRCAEECPFSPYFSPHEPHKFSAVHKVFGASNVSKLLLEVAESQRADAANSLVYEANLRLRDPVYGCMGVISTLQQQIQSLTTELHTVRSQVLRYKYKEAATSQVMVSSNSRDHNNVHPHQHHHHHASAAASAALVSSGMVSIATPPQAISTTSSPPAAAPLSSNVVFSSSSSTSASSLYTTNTTGYSSLSSDNLPYFD